MAGSKYSYGDIMRMNEAEFLAVAGTTVANKAWLKEAAGRTEIRKSYPRKSEWNEEKLKYVSVADKSKKPTIKTVPISFMSLKKAYCEEVLKLEKKVQKKETFRDRLMNL